MRDETCLSPNAPHAPLSWAIIHQTFDTGATPTQSDTVGATPDPVPSVGRSDSGRAERGVATSEGQRGPGRRLWAQGRVRWCDVALKSVSFR